MTVQYNEVQNTWQCDQCGSRWNGLFHRSTPVHTECPAVNKQSPYTAYVGPSIQDELKGSYTRDDPRYYFPFMDMHCKCNDCFEARRSAAQYLVSQMRKGGPGNSAIGGTTLGKIAPGVRVTPEQAQKLLAEAQKPILSENPIYRKLVAEKESDVKAYSPPPGPIRDKLWNLYDEMSIAGSVGLCNGQVVTIADLQAVPEETPAPKIDPLLEQRKALRDLIGRFG